MTKHLGAVEIRIANGALARRVERAVDDALAKATSAVDEQAARTESVPIVHLRTRRRFEALGPAALAGAIAVMRVTEKGARRLPSLVDDVRDAGALGVQIVWDGESPSRDRVEAHVFTILERARATPKAPPVVLSRTSVPARALRVLVSQRKELL